MIDGEKRALSLLPDIVASISALPDGDAAWCPATIDRLERSMNVLSRKFLCVMPLRPVRQARRRFLAALAALPFLPGSLASGTTIRAGWVLRAEDR